MFPYTEEMPAFITDKITHKLLQIFKQAKKWLKNQITNEP